MLVSSFITKYVLLFCPQTDAFYDLVREIRRCVSNSLFLPVYLFVHLCVLGGDIKFRRQEGICCLLIFFDKPVDFVCVPFQKDSPIQSRWPVDLIRKLHLFFSFCYSTLSNVEVRWSSSVCVCILYIVVLFLFCLCAIEVVEEE